MIVVIVLLSILIQTELYLFKIKRKTGCVDSLFDRGSCQYDHIPFNLKGNGNVFCECTMHFLDIWTLPCFVARLTGSITC